MKNIIKSFFLVALAALMLFSCTNVNDPTAVLESNGVVTTNKLVGIEIKSLPEALKGQLVKIMINGVVVDSKYASNATLRCELSDKAVFNTLADSNVLTFEAVGTDGITYKFGKYVGDTFGLGYTFEPTEAGYKDAAPEFVFTGECGLFSEPVIYGNGAKIHWWNIAGIDNTDWGSRPEMVVEDTGKDADGKDLYKYSYTFDAKAKTLANAGVIIAFVNDYDNCKLSGGDITGAALADVTGYGVYKWNDSASKFEKDAEASKDAKAITLEYTCVPVSEVILPAAFSAYELPKQTLKITAPLDNSVINIVGLSGLEVSEGDPEKADDDKVIEIDGSMWRSWDAEGSAVKITHKDTTAKYDFEAKATAATYDVTGWGSPFDGDMGYPKGFDSSIKIKLNGTEVWICYAKGKEVTFNWFLNRQDP